MPDKLRPGDRAAGVICEQDGETWNGCGAEILTPARAARGVVLKTYPDPGYAYVLDTTDRQRYLVRLH
jgi:hypothetical protein